MVFEFKAALPNAVFLLPVEFASNVIAPKAVLFCPEVFVVNAPLPIAVLLAPDTAASKAFSPRTVLPETEFAPLPIFIEFILASAVNVAFPVLSIVNLVVGELAPSAVVLNTKRPGISLAPGVPSTAAEI